MNWDIKYDIYDIRIIRNNSYDYIIEYKIKDPRHKTQDSKKDARYIIRDRDRQKCMDRRRGGQTQKYKIKYKLKIKETKYSIKDTKYKVTI